MNVTLGGCKRCHKDQCPAPKAPKNPSPMDWVTAFLVAIIGFLLLLFLFSGSASGAEPAVNQPAKVEAGKPADGKWCDIYLLRGRPKDMLVFDQEGRLVQDARHVYLWFQIASQQPMARVYRWPGLYRPANAIEELWEVRNLDMLEAADFHRMAEAGVAGK